MSVRMIGPVLIVASVGDKLKAKGNAVGYLAGRQTEWHLIG
jgi:hypothetical protein